MNKLYLSLMEKTLSAYSNEHILRYFNSVKRDGLTEHGFPRLTANIGILISYGVRRDLLNLFLEMMEFCCKTIPNVKAANDFSVREIISSIMELEKSGAVNSSYIERWKGYLASIDKYTCYNVYATSITDTCNNLALFTALSEFYRQKIGLCDSSDFIDLQIAQQLQFFDENGMYKDEKSCFYQPMVYDLVPRYLFSLLLSQGYKGKYYLDIDNILKKSALLTLKMQSVTGEVAFGGRSNQFLHNEASLCSIFEYEAVRYQKEGNYALAGEFKAAALLAIKNSEYWLSKAPISHVKNRYPIDSLFGCEYYSYFDKYMITTASIFYMASIFCDDSIIPTKIDEKPMVFATSKHFHKTFVKAGGYALQFDTNADDKLDASGLGRIHKKGAPSTICMSIPFPYTNENYCYNIKFGEYKNPHTFSICPTIKNNGEWVFNGLDKKVTYNQLDSIILEDKAKVLFNVSFLNDKNVSFSCEVDENGVNINAQAQNDSEDIGITFPVFDFDGEKHTKITTNPNSVLVEYEGWVCEYLAQNITSLEKIFANRNGLYKGYIVTGKGSISLNVKIYKAK